jgi:PPOX class probable F420-dependent enzyme
VDDIVDQRPTRIGGATRHRRESWTRASERGRGYVIAVTLLAGALTLGAGVWSLAAPSSFAEAVNFPNAEHFLHDVGAFQIGIGTTLLLAVAWSDGLALALAGFLVGNTIHAVNHAVDLHLGGHASDPWLLGAVSLLVAAALAVRLRELGYVVGAVGTAATPELEPFVRQKTALLVTYRRDGTPADTPLSVFVDGDRLLIRSYEQAWKTKRIRNRPEVEIAPSTARGKPQGPAIPARARRLEGAEARYAARALARKHPLLQGVLVPFAHRVGRSKTGRTVHFELVPLED